MSHKLFNIPLWVCVFPASRKTCGRLLWKTFIWLFTAADPFSCNVSPWIFNNSQIDSQKLTNNPQKACGSNRGRDWRPGPAMEGMGSWIYEWILLICMNGKFSAPRKTCGRPLWRSIFLRQPVLRIKTNRHIYIYVRHSFLTPTI